MRVALYIRESNLSKFTLRPGIQLTSLRELAMARGWTVTEEYIEGPFRNRGPRKSFQQLMRAAKGRAFEIVLFWSLERFCPENLNATLYHLQTLSSFGTNYLSYSEPFLDSTGSNRDVVISTIALITAHEHRRHGERVLEGLEKARRKGRYGGRPRVEIDLAKLYQLQLEDYSFAQIAAQLGVSKTTVSRLVRQQDESMREAGKSLKGMTS
jgi:DNA invertase Pin-like site-specific DNA recombinase